METTRRSANYHANIWDDTFLQSLNSPYMAQEYMDEVEKLKKEVKVLIDGTENLLDRLQLIDHLQRLDVSYHFRDEVKKLLDEIYPTIGCKRGGEMETMDLYVSALQFRLLRQHGYHVPQEFFNDFMDDGGNFKMCLASDVKGLLSLYEASYLSMEGESTLDLAKDFAAHHLKKRLDKIEDSIQAGEISHALELPTHWRVHKLEARWFIHVYESRSDANPSLLQLAKLNFNMVQAIYQNEIKSLSRWYKQTALTEKLGFVRHRLAECFYVALVMTPQPHLACSRMILCKAAKFILIMDDIYDIYGTMDEIEVLTKIIQSWDINELDNLPEYMQISFLALFNSMNEVAYNVMKDQGLSIITHLSKSWANMCKAFNSEARWHQQGYIPGFNEYLKKARISVGGLILLLHAYISIGNPIKKEQLESLEQYPGIIHWPSMVFRLKNDLETKTEEMQRGDAPSSVQCYMRETGCSEEDAVKHIKQLVDVMWKRMNKDIVMEKGMGFNESFCEIALNYARLALCLYQFGDGVGSPHCDTKQNIASLVVDPIPIHPSPKRVKTVCTMARGVVSMPYTIASRPWSFKKQAIAVRPAPFAQVPRCALFAAY